MFIISGGKISQASEGQKDKLVQYSWRLLSVLDQSSETLRSSPGRARKHFSKVCFFFLIEEHTYHFTYEHERTCVSPPQSTVGHTPGDPGVVCAQTGSSDAAHFEILTRSFLLLNLTAGAFQCCFLWGYIYYIIIHQLKKAGPGLPLAIKKTCHPALSRIQILSLQSAGLACSALCCIPVSEKDWYFS